MGSMDYSNMGPRSSEKMRLEEGYGEKRKADGEDLGDKQINDGTNDTHQTANKGVKGYKNFQLTEDGVSEGPWPSSPCAGRGGKDDSNVAPFRTTKLAAYTHFLSNVMRSKRFLLHLILTLSWYLRNKIKSRWEKFASLYNPFFRVSQITILAKARIARNTIRFSPWYAESIVSTTESTSSSTSFFGSMRAVHSPTWLQNGRIRSQ